MKLVAVKAFYCDAKHASTLADIRRSGRNNVGVLPSSRQPVGIRVSTDPDERERTREGFWSIDILSDTGRAMRDILKLLDLP